MRRILFPSEKDQQEQTIANERQNWSITSHNFDLGNAMRVSEDNTDLGWSRALLRKLADLVDDLLRSSLKPGWWRSRVWYCAG